jgi:hypothetical protein
MARVGLRRRMGYSHVVHELGGDHDGGDEQAVHAVRVDADHRGPRLLILLPVQRALREAVEVDVGDDEARGAAPRVPVDPLRVPPHGDRRQGLAPERRWRRRRRSGSGASVAALGCALQQPRQDGHRPGHARAALPRLHAAGVARRVVVVGSAGGQGRP